MAKVPIIKLRDSKHNTPIDISFNQLDGLNQVMEVDKAKRFYPELRFLIIFLKFFLHQRELNETYQGGIGSTLLFCLVLHYLRENRKKMFRAKQ